MMTSATPTARAMIAAVFSVFIADTSALPNASNQRTGETGPQHDIAGSSPVSLQWNGSAQAACCHALHQGASKMAFQARSPHLPQEAPKHNPPTKLVIIVVGQLPENQRLMEATKKAPKMNPRTEWTQ
jgi:hypothetical protein